MPVYPGIESARAGTEPACICRVPSGWVFLSHLQFLRGYCLLKSDPVVESINALDPAAQAVFLRDMVTVGEALLEVTGAYRINYALMSNANPILHAHIVPRHRSEPENLRIQPPWFYPNQNAPETQADYVRDRELMLAIREVVCKRLNSQLPY